MEKREYFTIAQDYLAETFDDFADNLINKPLKDAFCLEKDKVVNRWAKTALNEWENPDEDVSEEDVRQKLSYNIISRFSRSLSRLCDKMLDENSKVIEADEALEILHSHILQTVNSTIFVLSKDDQELMRGLFDVNGQYMRIAKGFFAKTETPYTAEKAEGYPIVDDLLEHMNEAYSEHIDDANLILRYKAQDMARYFDLPSDWQDVMMGYRAMTLNAFLDTYRQIENDLSGFIDDLQY